MRRYDERCKDGFHVRNAWRGRINICFERRGQKQMGITLAVGHVHKVVLVFEILKILATRSKMRVKCGVP